MAKRWMSTVAAMLALACEQAAAQVQTKDQAACVTGLVKAGQQVAAAQSKLQLRCVIDEAKGTIADADACIAADVQRKVAKAADKSGAFDVQHCAPPPPFAYIGAAAVNAVAQAEAEAFLRDALDGGAGLAVLSKASDKAGARCQKKLLTPLAKRLTTTLGSFNKCTKVTLRIASDISALRASCLGQLSAERTDPTSAIGKATAKIAKAREKSCPGIPVAAVFPGLCGQRQDAGFDACLEERHACRACILLDTMTDLGADCDIFDDGTADGSCGATTSSTTTTSSTASSSTPGSTSTTIPPESFAIAIGDTVSDGVPGAGAGNIESAGARDRYLFTATPGQTIYFDELAFSGTLGVPYELRDNADTLITSNTIGGAEPGRLTLSAGGQYVITVGSVTGTATGTYGFKLWDVPPDQMFAIAVGDTVSNGVPAAGAGNIEVPSARDIYTFTGTAGQVIFFDEQAFSGVLGLPYVMRDPSNAVVLSNNIGGAEPGQLTLPLSGTYTITMAGDTSNVTGTYAFKLWSVPASSMFAIAIGDTVSNGVPAAGAGNIEVPSVRDTYTFSGTAGQEIYVDEQAFLGVLGLPYTITDPSSAIFVSNMIAGTDPGRLTLPLTGTYTITVGSNTSDATGTYSFKLWPVPADQSFGMALGDTVSNGVPASGAGNIETPGVRDIYTFSATASTVLVFDELASGLLGMPYTVSDPSSAVVLSGAIGGADPPNTTLPATGTYTIRVGSSTSDATGIYAFEISAAP